MTEAKPITTRITRNANRSKSPVIVMQRSDDESDYETEEEEDDIEAILSGNKSEAKPAAKIIASDKKKPVEKAKVAAPKMQQPTKVEPKKEPISIPKKEIKLPPAKVPAKIVTQRDGGPPTGILTKVVNLRETPSSEVVKKVNKPLAEQQNLKTIAVPNTCPKELMNPMNKLFHLNFPAISTQPPRAVLCLSLIKLGNKIKEIKLPSLNWSYRITLQKLNKENSGGTGGDKGEVYTGDIDDSGIEESDRSNYAPVNISFVRVAAAETPNSETVKAVTFQNKSFQILLKGKQCRLIGSPQYIYDVTEIQTLLEVVEKVFLNHSYVELTEP